MTTKPFYQLSTEEILSKLKTSKEGLSQGEVNKRLSAYGRNIIKSSTRIPLIFKVFTQFKDLMVIILIVAGSISFYLKEYRDTIIMFSIVLINAIIGFIQEYKAEKTVDSIKSLIKAKAKVTRLKKTIEIGGEDLVPGDIVILQEGDAIPADVRIIEENNFSANDFSLTGESNPVKKFIHLIQGEVPLGDRNNMAFMGTTVATGNAIGIVVATGQNTEIGKIANLSQTTVEDLSPLQKELNDLAKKITISVIIIGVVLLIVGLALKFTLREAFLFALGIAASGVPEGVPAQVSIALSLATGRLAKQKAIIKKLSAVETLGSVHIICTDKTGTLTKNEMTVQKLIIGKKEFKVTGTGYEPKGAIRGMDGKALTEDEIVKYQLFFQTGVFASNAHVNPPDGEHLKWYSIGDPTEAALMTLAQKAHINTQKLEEQYPEKVEFTFDAIRKRMSSIREINGKKYVFVKGSPKSVLEKSGHYWDEGRIRPMDQTFIDFINRKDDETARMALRNLAYAYRELNSEAEQFSMDQVEENLIFLGTVSMADPPREDVKETIEIALKANIRIIIITGDYALTAEAIAKKIGFNVSPKTQRPSSITVVSGQELKTLSDLELIRKLINRNLIFSRTSPEDKLRIVDLLKKTGEIIAVTGDGVNDAPALKRADIGVSMGLTGTEVAKDSSEVVLLDDSFSTLVKAVEEGRTIFTNLKKTIFSSLTSNIGELTVVILSLIFAGFFNFPLAILAVQILAVDLVGEMIPLTVLTWDPSHKDSMTRAPRAPGEHMINRKSFIDIVWSGFLMGLLAFINFLLLFRLENVQLNSVSTDMPIYIRATTLTYISIVCIQWINILSRRTEDNKLVFTPYIWSNKKLLWGYLISFILLLNISYNPLISQFLHTGPLKIIDWFFVFVAGLIFLAIREFQKRIFAPASI